MIRRFAVKNGGIEPSPGVCLVISEFNLILLVLSVITTGGLANVLYLETTKSGTRLYEVFYPLGTFPVGDITVLGVSE